MSSCCSRESFFFFTFFSELDEALNLTFQEPAESLRPSLLKKGPRPSDRAMGRCEAGDLRELQGGGHVSWSQGREGM